MDDGGLDLRRRPEGPGRHAKRYSHVAMELGEHAETAVGLAARSRRQALGDLLLEHQRHRVNRPARTDERRHDGLRHAIGQITYDEHPPTGWRNERGVVPRARVRVEDLDVRETLAQLGGERAIDFERDHPAGAARQLSGERAPAGADLDDDVSTGGCDEIDDGAGDAGVAQEVLAKSAALRVHPFTVLHVTGTGLAPTQPGRMCLTFSAWRGEPALP